MSTISITLNPADRAVLSTTIERLIDMLDDLDADPDLEDGADDEPSLGWHYLMDRPVTAAAAMPDECEDENEHGGDVCDEPHDDLDQGDAEPFLGWRETCGQGQGQLGDANVADPNDTDAIDRNVALRFEGDGQLAAQEVLANLRRLRPDVAQKRVPLMVALGDPQALVVDGITIGSIRYAVG